MFDDTVALVNGGEEEYASEKEVLVDTLQPGRANVSVSIVSFKRYHLGE